MRQTTHQLGRPSRFGEPATSVITVRVTPRQRQELERVATENGTDLTGVIRDAVNEYVSDYKDDRVFRMTKGEDAA